MSKVYKPLFSYKKMNLHTEKNEKSLSRREIKNKIMNDEFKALDIEILGIVHMFKYITKAHMQKIATKNPKFIKDNMKKRLSKLTKTNLLTRHYFTWNEEIKVGDEVTLQEKRSPYFYSLSKSGMDFYCKSNRLNFNIKNYSLEYDTLDILNKMTINQVMVNYIEKLSNKIEYKMDIQSNIKKLKKDIIIHGLINLKVEDKDIPFLLIPVRKDANWQSNVKEYFSSIQEYIKIDLEKKINRTFKNPPILIFVCEDDLHMKDVFESLYTMDGFNDILCLFTTDVRQLNQDLSNSLNTFRVCDNNQFELIEFKTELLL